MLLRLFVAVLILLCLPACVRARAMPGSGGSGQSYGSGETRRSRAARGGRQSFVECHFDRGLCYEKAARLCPNGYEILDSASGRADSSHQGSLLIKCTTGTSARERMKERDAKRQAKSPLKDAPLGAGGFEFGDSREKSERLCREPGHTWVARNARAVCGGTAAPRADRPMKTVLQFCDDFLCSVTLRIEPNGDKKKDQTWVRELIRLRRKLIHKYGQWTKSKKPATWCRHELLECLAEGRAEYKYVWAWDTGERIILKLDNKRGSTLGPSVKIIYVTPERMGADMY